MRCPQHLRTVPNASCPRWKLCCPRCGFLGRLVPCCTMTCSIEYFWAWAIIRSSHQFPFFWLSSTGGASSQSSAARRLNQGRLPLAINWDAPAMAPVGEAATAWAQAMEHFVPWSWGFQSFFDMEKFTSEFWDMDWYGLILANIG